MKKLLILVLILSAVVPFGFSQTAAFTEATGVYYRVYSEIGRSHAQSVADRLDAYFEMYNDFFHFDPRALGTKLRVRIFSEKSNFDAYLSTVIDETRGSFVYLQYRDLEKSELLGYGSLDEEAFNTSLVHYGFVQFLKSFIPDPPLWLQKGFAVYLEKSMYDAAGKRALIQSNLGWVRYLKSFVNQESVSDFIPLPLLLKIDVDGANSQIEDFYAQSWGLVSFLLETDKKNYNRVIWDTINALSPSATREENEAAIAAKAFSWVTIEQAYADFQEYINTVKTFPDLVRDGMASYSNGELTDAETLFTKAIERNPSHDIPYYYLGLISYSRQEYSLADYYYKTSIQMGADPGLAYYALGVNAFADERYTDARNYLEQAVNTDPAGYGTKTGELIERIEDIESGGTGRG